VSPFGEKYLRHEERSRVLQDWAHAHPEFVRVKSIGKSAEGRDLWILEIGREPGRRRAAAWVDGNMHAVELCGSSVALAIAEDVIALHRGEDRHDLPTHVRERLKGILFYVLPRMSPDGAEAVLRDGRYVRSNPRDRREHAPVPRWVAADKKMNQQDLAIYRQIEQWGEQIGGYPMVSGFEEFIYEPEKPIHGDITDFIYHTRGAIAYACELWDLFARLGIERRKPFVEHYTRLTRENLLALAKFDREKNQKRIFRGWQRFRHPQLGEVEIGGTVSTVGLTNPPYEMLADIAQRQAAMYLRVAAMAPALEMHARHANGRIEVEVANAGYLPTYVLDSAKKLSLDARVFVEVEPLGDASIDPRDARTEIGHLEGWGRGLYNQYIFYQRSRGSVSRRTVSIPVQGRGKVRVRAKGLRVGEVVQEITVG